MKSAKAAGVAAKAKAVAAKSVVQDQKDRLAKTAGEALDRAVASLAVAMDRMSSGVTSIDEQVRARHALRATTLEAERQQRDKEWAQEVLPAWSDAKHDDKHVQRSVRRLLPYGVPWPVRFVV